MSQAPTILAPLGGSDAMHAMLPCRNGLVRSALIACVLSLAVGPLGLAACSSGPGHSQADGGSDKDAGGGGIIDAFDDHSIADATISGATDVSDAMPDGGGDQEAGIVDAGASDATGLDGSPVDAATPTGIGAEPVEGGGGGTLCGATCGPGQMLCQSPAFAGVAAAPGICPNTRQTGLTACFPESAAGCAGLPKGPMCPGVEVCGLDGGCPGPMSCCGGVCLDTTSDPRGCGPCIPCAAPNGSAVCIDSKCVVACLPGWTACGTSCSVTTADAANCGACGHACAASEICTGSVCVPQSSVWVVTGLTSPSEINVDQNNVYWSDSTLNSISGAPKTGGSTFTVVPPQSTALTSIVLDDKYLYYWQGATIMRAPNDGTGSPQVVATISMQGLALGVDSTSVYFTGLPSMVPPTIQSVPKGGGTPTTYLTTTYAYASGGFPVTFFDAVSDNLAMYVMVSNGNLRGGSGTFAAFDFAGTVGGPDVTGDFLIPESHMGVDATNVYAWYQFGIEAFDKYGGFAGAASVSPPYAGASCGVAWANSSGINWNALVSMANGGYDDYFEQAAQIIAPGVGPVVNMIADGDSIYWTDSGNGAIGKLRLP